MMYRKTEMEKALDTVASGDLSLAGIPFEVEAALPSSLSLRFPLLLTSTVDLSTRRVKS